MVKAVFKPKFSGQYRSYDFDDYKIDKLDLTTGTIRLTYDQDRAGRAFDAERSSKSIQIKLDNLHTYTPTQGDFAGQEIITSGTVTSVKFMAPKGKLQATFTEIELDAGILHWLLNDDRGDIYQNLVTGGGTFTGPNSTQSGWDLETGSGNDIVRANSSWSYIKDRGGKDKYFGSADGWDIVAYSEWDSSGWTRGKGIVADLAKGTVRGPDGNVDKVSDVEEIVGTNRRDKLFGDDEDNSFRGLRGRDTIDGRGGFDSVRYRSDENDGGYDGVKVDLSKGTARDGFGNTDILKNIEGAEGSDVDDTLIGDNKDNWFRGRDGADKFVFKGTKFGSDDVDDFSRSEGDKLVIKAANSRKDLRITTDSDGTLIKFNKNAEIFLEDWDQGLKASDFIF